MEGVVKAEEMTEGTVILLPFGRTATVAEPPKVGRTFVTFRTQHGKSRLRRGEEVLVEDEKKGKEVSNQESVDAAMVAGKTAYETYVSRMGEYNVPAWMRTKFPAWEGLDEEARGMWVTVALATVNAYVQAMDEGKS